MFLEVDIVTERLLDWIRTNPTLDALVAYDQVAPSAPDWPDSVYETVLKEITEVPEHPEAYLVEGAGKPNVNGTYRRDGVFKSGSNTFPKYTKGTEQGVVLALYPYSGQWYISQLLEDNPAFSFLEEEFDYYFTTRTQEKTSSLLVGCVDAEGGGQEGAPSCRAQSACKIRKESEAQLGRLTHRTMRLMLGRSLHLAHAQ